MAWIAPAISAAGSIAGGLLGGDTGDPIADVKHIYGKDFGNQYVNPWRDMIMNMPQQEYYPGQTVADMHPGVSAGYQGMIDFGQNNPAYGLQSMQGAAGLNSLGLGNQFLQQSMQQGGPSFQYDQNAYDQSMANLMPAMQGTYDDMTRDIGRELNWSTLPGIDMGSAMAGGFGSSRGDLASGMATGMAEDRMADIGSQIFQNASNQSQDAAMRGGLGTLNAQLGSQGQMLSGAQGLANVGLPGIGDAYQTGLGNNAAMVQGGLGFQGYDQSLLNADKAAWDFGQSQPWLDEANRISLLNQTVTPGSGAQIQPGMGGFAGAINGAQAALGLYDAFKPMFGTQSTSIGSQPWMTPGTASNDYLGDLGIF